MAHRNARLTVHGRRLIVVRVLEEGWSPATAAEASGVSRATVYKWLARFREHGEAGLVDRTSRPRRCPNRLNDQLERRILLARKRRRWGPHLATRARIGRATLYRHPELRATVEDARTRGREAHTLSSLHTELDHLRISLEAIAEKVRHHEELLRQLNHDRQT